jgi:hypothetical protein
MDIVDDTISQTAAWIKCLINGIRADWKKKIE